MTLEPEPNPYSANEAESDALPAPLYTGRRGGGLLDRVLFLNLLLALAMLLLATKSLLSDAVALRTEGNSELIQDETRALGVTKGVFQPELALDPGGKRAHNSTESLVASLQSDEVVKSWRQLATAKTGRQAEWRRLGIVLALFHKPGALDALKHVGDRFPPTVKRNLAQPLPDPFGHGAVSISPQQEIACWKAIYGKAPPSPSQVPGLRHTLSQLKLDWFQDIAAAQLLAKTGFKSEARKVADRAAHGASGVKLFDALEEVALIFGVIALIGVGFYAAIKSALKKWPVSPVSATNYVADAARLYGAFDTPEEVRRGTERSAVPPPNRVFFFPYPTLIQTFLVYLLAQEGIGLFVGIALVPFQALFLSMSAANLLRVELVLQLLLYIPVIGLPLLILKRRIGFDPLTGKRMGWRDMLFNIGFRARNVLTEIGAGVFGYTLLMPLVLLTTLISNRLFAHFHTPANPAELWMLSAGSPADKILVLLVTSVGAPLAEETLFRGILYPALRGRLGIWGGAAVSAAIFSGLHPTLPGGFLPLWTVGFGLALIYEWRKSLLPGMVLHGVFNGFITLSSFAIFTR